MNRTNLQLIRKCLKSKIPSLYFTLSYWLNYHKEFSAMVNFIENNRIHCWTYCLTTRYCSPDRELYMVKFTASNSKNNLVFKRLLYTNPYLD